MSILQYPQTGRTSCNLVYLLAPLELILTCSTLRRVEPHATLLTAPEFAIVPVLQYPQTGRTSCNRRKLLPGASMPHLAVPSDGSNLMQHQGNTLISGNTFVLQYPQTGRTSCNVKCHLDYLYWIGNLQYPQTGRTSCNMLATDRQHFMI